MINRSLVIGIGILVLVVLGFYFLTNMTGNVITGAVVAEERVENEYFRIDGINETDKGVLNGTQNSSRSG